MTEDRELVQDRTAASGHMAGSLVFSVVIPLYNKRAYIRRAVDSVLGQSFHDFELIVVDDGSTDGSHEMLADITDPRYRVIRQENQGEGPARNAGMALAVGEWIAFLDGDDMWLPFHLLELQRIVVECPDAGLVSTDHIQLTDGSFPDPSEVAKDTAARVRRIDYFAEASRKIGIVTSSTSAISRHAYEQLGGFTNHRAGADLEYWARIALHHPVAISDRVTAVYFRNTGGVMEGTAAERGRSTKSVNELRDLSPSVRMLCDLAEAEPERWQDPSTRAYVNSRIYNGVKGALYRGDLDMARHYARFYLEPPALKERVVRQLLRLPDTSINAVLAIYRSAYHRAR